MIFISVIHDVVDQLTQTKVIKYLFSCKYIRFINKIQYLNENITIKSASYGFKTIIKYFCVYFLVAFSLAPCSLLCGLDVFLVALSSKITLYSSEFIRYLDEPEGRLSL